MDALESNDDYYGSWQKLVEFMDQHCKFSIWIPLSDLRQITYSYMEHPFTPCSPFCTQLYEDWCTGCREQFEDRMAARAQLPRRRPAAPAQSLSLFSHLMSL